MSELEKNSSVKVSVNAKRQYTFEVKVYFNNLEDGVSDYGDDVVAATRGIYDKLYSVFKDGH